MGIGDWGLGIGDWAQSPISNPQYPIPNPQNEIIKLIFESLNNYKIWHYYKIKYYLNFISTGYSINEESPTSLLLNSAFNINLKIYI